MKSGTFTNNTSFSATAASIQIPTGGNNVTVDYGDNEQILIPPTCQKVNCSNST